MSGRTTTSCTASTRRRARWWRAASPSVWRRWVACCCCVNRASCAWANCICWEACKATVASSSHWRVRSRQAWDSWASARACCPSPHRRAASALAGRRTPRDRPIDHSRVVASPVAPGTVASPRAWRLAQLAEGVQSLGLAATAPARACSARRRSWAACHSGLRARAWRTSSSLGQAGNSPRDEAVTAGAMRGVSWADSLADSWATAAMARPPRPQTATRARIQGVKGFKGLLMRLPPCAHRTVHTPWAAATASRPSTSAGRPSPRWPGASGSPSPVPSRTTAGSARPP